MRVKNYIKGFNTFNQSSSINEMASELTKLGVPKNLMQFIHKLSGKVQSWSHRGDKQVDPRTGSELDKFHTFQEPRAARLGPFPAREDVPLSHDTQVIGTKTGQRNIFHYLTQVLDSRKDSGLRLILINPNDDQIHYITRKTGKTTPAQRADKYGHEYTGAQTRNMSREDGVAEKLGLYVRVVTIDADSGNPVAGWEGTIGQMRDDMDDDSVLYIMEEENRVRTKRTTRSERKTLTEDQFIKYFIDNFKSIADKFASSAIDKKSEEWKEIHDTLTPAEIRSMSLMGQGNDTELGRKKSKLDQLAKEIDEGGVNPDSLKMELDQFQKLAMREGEYSPVGTNYTDKQKASISDMASVHTVPVLASMFLQYVTLKKVSKPFYTDDPFKEFGLDDLLFDMD